MKRLLPLFGFLLLFTVGCDSGGDDDGVNRVTVTGTIQNVTALGVDDATVTFDDGQSRGASSAEFMAPTNTDGEFSIQVPEGTYTVTISAPGYETETFEYTTGGGEITRDLFGQSNISGSVVSSQDSDITIANARVSFTRGSGESVSLDEEAIDLEVTTDDEGNFEIIGAPTGTYLCVIRISGFLPTPLYNVELTAGDVELGDAAAVEAPPAGTYRIVLSWGFNPDDLDSHLTGPNGQGGRFHVYYSDETFGDIADLDDDDTDSYGPETITINPENDGVYRYSVYNFEDSSPEGSQGIAGEIENSSPARVQVYSSDGLVRSYTAPASAPGNTWRVLEMDVSGGNVAINDVNEWVTANGSSDIGSFRAPNTLKAAMSAAGL